MKKIKDNSLYLVISEEYGRSRSAVDIAQFAIAGGVDIIQMREKKPREELLSIGNKLADLCRKSGVIFIVNDDPILAKQVDADGVHLGQEDLALFGAEEARAILGKDKIIGISTSSIKEIEEANKTDIDYIGFGPVFPTTVKEKCIGIKDVERALKISQKPVFFIGGINLENVGSLIEKGAKRISLIRAIAEADDIASAARSFRRKLDARESL